jgi:hypothetical protein
MLVSDEIGGLIALDGYSEAGTGLSFAFGFVWVNTSSANSNQLHEPELLR